MIFKMKHLAKNSNQTWYKPFLHEGNSIIQMKGRVLFKGGIITKVQKDHLKIFLS
jgi:hypothetical protein